MYALRQIVSIAVLPATVLVVIPVWIARSRELGWRMPAGVLPTISVIAAAVCVAVGLPLFLASVALFWRRGRGTLAPWDPPRRLVVSGPYCYVRNPMISGVVFILFGEALALRSSAHLTWAVMVLAVNLVYIPAVEEPMLAERFGGSYREYTRHVPRMVPRLRPWRPATPAR